MQKICPCGSDMDYTECCERWHRGAAAPTAEALMRSRYSAYTLQLDAYLMNTWHAETRPTTLGFDDEGNSTETRWLGLKIVGRKNIDADHAMVEFVARFRRGGSAAIRLHECSRFVRENGRWYYIDGELVDGELFS